MYVHKHLSISNKVMVYDLLSMTSVGYFVEISFRYRTDIAEITHRYSKDIPQIQYSIDIPKIFYRQHRYSIDIPRYSYVIYHISRSPQHRYSIDMPRYSSPACHDHIFLQSTGNFTDIFRSSLLDLLSYSVQENMNMQSRKTKTNAITKRRVPLSKHTDNHTLNPNTVQIYLPKAKRTYRIMKCLYHKKNAHVILQLLQRRNSKKNMSMLPNACKWHRKARKTTKHETQQENLVFFRKKRTSVED